MYICYLILFYSLSFFTKMHQLLLKILGRFLVWIIIKNRLPFEQSFPVHWPRQIHFWVSRSKSPCPEQSGKHCLASWSTVAQVGPLHPCRQTQDPSTQNPWSEQFGSGQSAEKYFKKKLVKKLTRLNKLKFSELMVVFFVSFC